MWTTAEERERVATRNAHARRAKVFPGKRFSGEVACLCLSANFKLAPVHVFSSARYKGRLSRWRNDSSAIPVVRLLRSSHQPGLGNSILVAKGPVVRRRSLRYILRIAGLLRMNVADL